MHMKNIFIILACISNFAFGQADTKWVEITAETKYLASTVKADAGYSNDKDRVLVKASLPIGSVGYIIKITVNSTNGNSQSLISSLGSITSPQLGLIANLVTHGDGNRCDVYIFNSEKEANNFKNKWNFTSCKRSAFAAYRVCYRDRKERALRARNR